MAPQGVRQRIKPMSCPFCEVKIPRPEALTDRANVDGGWCSCGALFVADETGRGGGEAMLEGLSALCDGDIDRAMALRAGADYEMKEVNWRPRNHSIVAARPGRGRNFGQPKIWFFRKL